MLGLYCILLRVDLRSDEFPSYLEPYLHEKTSHFIHEFISFAASPFDMIAYDQNVNYDWPESHPELSERREDATQGDMLTVRLILQPLLAWQAFEASEGIIVSFSGMQEYL